jgi:hypothetical protein
MEILDFQVKKEIIQIQKKKESENDSSGVRRSSVNQNSEFFFGKYWKRSGYPHIFGFLKKWFSRYNVGDITIIKKITLLIHYS